MLYNREEALVFLGKASNDLNILRDRSVEIQPRDFEDNLHKLIYGVLKNISLQKDISEADGILVDNYLKDYPSKHVTFVNGNGVEILDKAKEVAKSKSFEYAYNTVRKMSLLRSFMLVGMDIRELYDENSLDITTIEMQRAQLDKMSIEQIKQHFKNKLIEIDIAFQSKTDSYSFKAGDGIKDLLERCKQGQSWGATFQSKLYNSVFSGMQFSKFLIRSAGTGGSKTRMSLGDMCNISCSERYIPSQGEWVKNDNPQHSVFISTELSDDEIHLAMLATVAGVPEETIKAGKYSEEITYRLERASTIIEESKIHCEYNSNFNISELENIIERNIIQHGAQYIFFDYIQITANLSQELNRLFGYTLREDQMLNQLSTALKNLANKYNVFICSSTQLNRSYKTDGYIDVTHLRGGKQTA